jgi:hypothetical protein
MLDAVEPFLLDGRDQLTVTQQGRGGISVEAVRPRTINMDLMLMSSFLLACDRHNRFGERGNTANANEADISETGSHFRKGLRRSPQTRGLIKG